MLIEELKKNLKGEVLNDELTLKKYSRDASLFEVFPEVIVFPKDIEDLKNLVFFVKKNKSVYKNLSLTFRAGGTDMSGGSINDSIIVDFSKYLNHIGEIKGDFIETEPGVFYRDFEKATLGKKLILPTFPASREICAVGGMVANNAGGENSLVYGKTAEFVSELKIILADGNEYLFRSLNKEDLEKKIKQDDFEGGIYKRIYNLIDSNYELLKNAKPNVHKNSAGYDLWDVWDKTNFDLTKLFTGSQGTLGAITQIKFKLIEKKNNTASATAVIFLKNLNNLGELVNKVLGLKPASFESFDKYTFRLALKFFYSFLKLLGAKNMLGVVISFLPEFFIILTKGMPEIILLAEFEEVDKEKLVKKLQILKKEVSGFNLTLRIAEKEKDIKKYWSIRRESFNLLRHRIKDKQTAPFIDDFIVKPEYLPEFLPKLYQILDKGNLFYTIAGHVGEGNFHVIPLMSLEKKEERDKIPWILEMVHNLIFEYKGSMTAEHNDGLIRSPHLERMYGSKVFALFEETKKIFDPENIFNPRKKAQADKNFGFEHIKRS